MKKIVGLSLVILLVIFNINFVYATNAYDIDMQTSSNFIDTNQEQVVVTLELKKYSGDGSLGYQGILEYDKDVFDTPTVTALNNWEKINYSNSTGIFTSRTNNEAAQGTKFAQIILKVKKNITYKDTTVKIVNLLLTDGLNESTVNKQIDFKFKTQQNEEYVIDNFEPDISSVPTENTNQNSTSSGTATTTGTQNTGDTNANANASQIANLPSINDTTSNVGNTTNNEVDNQSKQFKVEAVTDKTEATGTDTTKAENNIPQTGEESTTIIIIGLVLVLGTFGFIRYKSIKLK